MPKFNGNKTWLTASAAGLYGAASSVGGDIAVGADGAPLFDIPEPSGGLVLMAVAIMFLAIRSTLKKIETKVGA